MKKIRSNGVSALETTPVYASQLNEVTEVINKSLGLDADGDGDFIPENVYPVADGEGGLIAGDIEFYGYPRMLTLIGENIAANLKATNNFDRFLNAILIGRSIFSQSLDSGTNTGCIIIGNYAAVRGDDFAHSVIIGEGACQGESSQSNAPHSVVIGASTLQMGCLDYNVAVGHNAGNGDTKPGYGNLFIGAGTHATHNNPNQCAAIGTFATVNKDRQIVLGREKFPNYDVENPIELVTRGVHINTRDLTAKNTTATLTADECLAGVITSTSAAAVSLTLPSAADLIAVLNGGAQGTTFELIVDNSGGSNSITITPSASITAITSPFTITNPMIVTTAQKVGCFKFYFTSATSAIVSRIW